MTGCEDIGSISVNFLHDSKNYKEEQHQNNIPGTVGDFNADPIALLATTLRGGIIAGSRPTQTSPWAASIIVGAGGPARPGTKAPIDCNITDLLVTNRTKNKTLWMSCFFFFLRNGLLHQCGFQEYSVLGDHRYRRVETKINFPQIDTKKKKSITSSAECQKLSSCLL